MINNSQRNHTQRLVKQNYGQETSHRVNYITASLGLYLKAEPSLRVAQSCECEESSFTTALIRNTYGLLVYVFHKAGTSCEGKDNSVMKSERLVLEHPITGKFAARFNDVGTT
jgi:hypothetical protein